MADFSPGEVKWCRGLWPTTNTTMLVATPVRICPRELLILLTLKIHVFLGRPVMHWLLKDAGPLGR